MTKLRFCLISLCILMFALTAMAQIQNGQFTGTVTDASGAALAGAKVTITNPATNLQVTTTTNGTGVYSAKELPVGVYKITVEAPGFKTYNDAGVTLDPGAIARVDVKMQLGQAREVVEVTGAAANVQTEDSKLSSTIGAAQINNLPLNGRNVFDLMQLNAGAVNVAGVDFENGHNTVVNGVREDFNGFLINGVSNKGLSGGVVNTPIQDTVEEFQQLGLNMSAQYGNSAGSTVNLVTKSGTNQLHGSVWEYLRNSAANANDYFLNQQGVARPALRWNQFGFTLGGPIMKDKLFFFTSYQGSRFTTVGTPSPVTVEAPQWQQAVQTADSNSGVQSVASLLYSTFKPSVAGTMTNTVDQYITGGFSDTGFTSYVDYLCPDTSSPAIAARFQSILGVLPSDNFLKIPALKNTACSTTPAAQPGTVGRTAAGSSLPFQNASVALFKSQTGSGINQNLFNGNESTLRLDYNWNTSNRLSVNYNDARTTDAYGPCAPSCTRGFTNPIKGRTPNGQFGYVHTFTPSILNDFRAGYAQNVSLINTSQGGVPSTSFDDGSVGFGSYSGYPQFFKENVYTYSDMVAITHGRHNIKIGVDFRRNIENSEFNVARPSYYFNDPLFFAADAPYSVSAGVNPGICAPPCSQGSLAGLIPSANLESNVRHWRNLEMGSYFQDDWKVTKRLTLQLGLRYDLYKRHTEENNKATTFILGPGSNPIEGVINANAPAGTVGVCDTASEKALAQLAGVCGPGGFAPSSTLGKGRYKDFGPRVGFAWDVFGDGRTSLRGGFGLAYEGTLYNPLSNSRWNLPYYSFNNVTNFVGGDVNSVVYGPTSCAGTNFPNNCVPIGGAQFGPGGVAPTYSGPPSGSQGQGFSGAQAQGNIDGWNPLNPNLASLTGIIFPQGVDDPYIYNYYLGFQREILPKTVLEVDFVGTTGHKLFRAEDVNRLPGALLPAGATMVNNIGETLLGYGGRPNPNYGRLRVWENVVNSSYNSLQASVKRQMSHGLLFNVNYTYSHSIDNGSTWHSGATSANGAGAGEGFTLDPTNPELDRGNSIYDIRQRLVINHVWQLPGQSLKGVKGIMMGGWSLNGVWQLQSGAHWEPFRSSAPRLTEITIVDPVNNPKGACTAADIPSNCVNKGGDYLLTRGRNERPDSSLSGFGSFNHNTWANGWCQGASVIGGCVGGTLSQSNLPVITNPCLACVGNLGRNTFVGPGIFQTDMSLTKIFRLTERFNLKFDASAFNVFNRTNFELATGGTANKNNIASGNFGVAGGVIGQRTMQFGLKLNF
jgi:hypothetical protein